MLRTIRRSISRKANASKHRKGKRSLPILESRRIRRKAEGFAPQYNDIKPVTYAEYHGVGYERFNGKYVKVAEVAQ